jgi:glycosyltransferase involved in cell wall biosynthesis
MPKKQNILFISHDANRAGGQIMLLDFIKYFSEKGFQNTVLLLDGGVLEEEFDKYAKVLKYPKTPIRHFSIKERIKSKFTWGQKDEKKELFEYLSKKNLGLIYTNTIATAWVLPELSFLNLPIISHIHELEFSIVLYSKPEFRKYQFEHSAIIIACSDAVGENLIKKHQVNPKKIKTIHSFIDNQSILNRIQNTDNQSIKIKYDIPKDNFLVSSCGNAEWRKGLDIFLLVAAECQNPDIHFIWIGIQKSGELYEKALFDIERLGLTNRLTLIEPTPEAVEIIASTDIFAMTSREDPFPLVMLEAALAEKPIIGFAQSGGIGEFVETDAGFVIPYLNMTEFVHKIEELAQNPAKAKELGANAKQKVLKKYNFANSMKLVQSTISEVQS